MEGTGQRGDGTEGQGGSDGEGDSEGGVNNRHHVC